MTDITETMLKAENKSIEGEVELYIYLDEDGTWALSEDVDTQTYDTYEAAKEDYDKVINLKTLTEVFKWEGNPFGV